MTSKVTVYYMACGDVEAAIHAHGGTVTLIDLEPSDALIIGALSEAATAKESYSPPESTILAVETWYFD